MKDWTWKAVDELVATCAADIAGARDSYTPAEVRQIGERMRAIARAERMRDADVRKCATYLRLLIRAMDELQLRSRGYPVLDL